MDSHLHKNDYTRLIPDWQALIFVPNLKRSSNHRYNWNSRSKAIFICKHK